jgi:hypothetical protein
MIFAGLLSIALTGSALAQPMPTAAELKADNDRLRKENQALEALTQRLRMELDDARAAAVQAKIQADAFEMRVKKLQDELTLFKANRQAPVTTREDPKGELTSRTKPKPALIQGKITAIGKDGRMLQVSVGSDSGVREGQSLEVFRLPTVTGQKPLYMGTISLTRVDPQASLGEFKPVSGEITRPKLGDEVANEFIVK